MPTIQFTRNTVPEREGGPGWKAGEVVELKESSARRWVVRGAAVTVAPVIAPVVNEIPEVEHGDAVESATDVQGQDGGDSSDRAELDEGTIQPRKRSWTRRNRGE